MCKSGLLIVVMLACLAVVGSAKQERCLVESFFVTPTVDQVIERRLIEALDQAEDSIIIAMYSFTDDELGAAVMRAYARGVDVRILLDEAQKDGAQGREWPKLVAAGIPVSVERVIGLMHHAFVVIDTRLTITGSYNWTASADENNFENVVFIECPEIAWEYTNEFFSVLAALGSQTASHPLGQELFLDLVSVTSPVGTGEEATVAVKTLPGAECTIRVRYQSGWSTAAGLYSKQADEHGEISWTWYVGPETTPGTWLIYVTAKLGEQVARLETHFAVAE